MSHASLPHSSPTVLIVDDDRDFADSAADFARAHGFDAHQLHSLAESDSLSDLPPFDLMLLDLELPDGSGLELLSGTTATSARQVAIVTGHPSVETAADAVGSSLVSYMVKPLSPAQFEELLERAAAAAGHLRAGHELPGMIGNSPPMQLLGSELRRVAASMLSVLLTGESGTGKELAARALHRLSGRHGPFVAVNCGAIAPDLLASHLFGHERGSFTGAGNRHIGYFEQANGGTLFLDEITEMPLALQVYLLRVLETGVLTRVGGSEETPVDVRVVSACNRDPSLAVQDCMLREDLFYRLADVQLELPPLRERGTDAVLIAHAILDELNTLHGVRKRFAAGSEDAIAMHAWPGNVRELRSSVRRAFFSAAGDELHVTPDLRRLSAPVTDSDEVCFRVGMSYAEVEREMLLKTLAHCNHDRTRTARTLGVSVRTVHNQIGRLRKGGIQVQ